MISKFKLVPLSVFAILMASLIAGCSTPPTRGTGYRSSGSGASPSSYKSSIASFSTVSWQALPGWQDDDLSQAWPAWLKSCEALHKKSGDVNWRSVCTQAGNVSSRDAQAIRTYFENNFQAYKDPMIARCQLLHFYNGNFCQNKTGKKQFKNCWSLFC